MEAMVSQLSPPTDTHLSTTMASAMLMLRPSPTMVSMEPMVSQLSPPTDTHLSTTMASVLLMLRPNPTMVSMEPMVSQLSPPTDTHPSTTMASVMLRLRLNPSGVPDTSQLTALPHSILMATTCPSKLCKLICCAELLTFFVLCTNPLDPKLPCYSKEMFKSYTHVFFVKIVMKQINVTNSVHKK